VASELLSPLLSTNSPKVAIHASHPVNSTPSAFLASVFGRLAQRKSELHPLSIASPLVDIEAPSVFHKTSRWIDLRFRRFVGIKHSALND